MRNSSITEQRIIIDIKAGMESYNEVIINDVIRIRREYNLEDAMTKASVLP